MFVCVCNGITDTQIREAVGLGACSLGDLSACLGVAAGCGCCAEFADKVVRETLQTQIQALPENRTAA